MANKLLIVMHNSSPEEPAALAAALSQAAVAAAMEYDVEVVLSGPAGRIAVPGVAAALKERESGSRTIYDMIREAFEAGAVFKVCGAVLERWGDELIPEISETVGAAYLVSEAMDDDTLTLTY